MPSIGSIVLALIPGLNGAYAIAVITEKRTTTTRTGETTEYLCHLQPSRNINAIPSALVNEDDLTAIDRGYSYGSDALLKKSPAYAWAAEYANTLLAPAPPTPPVPWGPAEPRADLDAPPAPPAPPAASDFL